MNQYRAGLPFSWPPFFLAANLPVLPALPDL